MIRNWAEKSGILFFAFFVLFGCAGLPRPEAMKAEVAAYQLPKLPEDGKAIVYVVRPSSFGKDFSFNVFVDNQDPKSEMGYTMGSQYIYFDLTPGEHRILSRADHWAEINVSAKIGDIIFIQQKPSMGAVTLNNKLLNLQDFEGKYYVKTLPMGTIINGKAPTQSAAHNALPGTMKGAQVKYSSTSGQSVAPSFLQAGTLPADKALIYIYRPPGQTGFAAFSGTDGPVPFGVKANGKTVITLIRGGYYAYLTEPGRIEFSTFEVGFMAPNSVSSITVDVKAQGAYYLKGSHGKGLGGRAHLEFVAPEVGLNEITNCKIFPQ